jgi:hypothetical protein
MAEQQKQINFTIVPNEEGGDERPHVYANYCAVGHTPFDFSLTFCQVMPLSEKDVRQAEAEGVVRAPVRVRVVTPVNFIPQLISALQEHWRLFSEGGAAPQMPPQGGAPVH